MRDWGLLAPVLAQLRNSADFDLQLAVTGQHLSPQGVDSLANINADGFTKFAAVPGVAASDTAEAVTKSLSAIISGFGELLAKERPDLLIVLGDRYEILGAVIAAMMTRIPIAHLCGGDVTEGVIDEAIRHAITKMSHLHFVTNAEAEFSGARVGESPAHIYKVGSPGLDRIRDLKPISRTDFFRSIGFKPRPLNAFVTFHPVTLEADSQAQCTELLIAFHNLGNHLGLIFTGVNADPEGQSVEQLIRNFVNEHENAIFVASLGSERYLSGLAHIDVIIGNSSSGLYEAPSFGVPTINIGSRQAGRVRAASVIDCAPQRDAIVNAIWGALALDCSEVINPYGDGHAVARVVAVGRKFAIRRICCASNFSRSNEIE